MSEDEDQDQTTPEIEYVDQEKLLDASIQVVKANSFQMRQSIDKNKLRHCLKFSKNILDTLKNPQLSIKYYHQLYMTIFDEMQYLYNYFKEEARRGRNMRDLYDIVQQCDSIISRIFLMILVGSVYIETGQVPATEIIFDLLNIIKGVQHPLRGLFCRYFLLKMLKDKLPDKGNEFEKKNSTFEESIKFILTNLDDMNRLWIRLSSSSNSKDNKNNDTQSEREDLKLLIGENIIRLSSLNGITQEIYQKQVLPKILDILIESKDQLSQQYLMECLINAFPDEFNILCMNTLLETCSKLENGVDVNSLFITLMNKLARFVENSKDQNDLVESAEKIFDLLKENINKIITEGLNDSNMLQTNKIIELQVAFMKFTIKCCPDKDKLLTINYILESTVSILSKNKDANTTSTNQLIWKLLVSSLESPLSIFDMPFYPELMKYLDYNSRTSLSMKIIETLISYMSSKDNNKSNTIIDNSEKMSVLIGFVRPLLEDSPDASQFDALQFEYEQESVCRILFIVQCDDPMNMYEILNVLKNVFMKGGSKRMKYTLPCLVNAYISLAYGTNYASLKINNIEDCSFNNESPIHKEYINKYSNLRSVDTTDLFCKFINKIYNQINDIILVIKNEYPDIAFKLLLNISMQVNDIKIARGSYEDICYSSLIEALDLITSGKIQNENKNYLLNLLIGNILNLTILNKDNWLNLCTNIINAAQSLSKKSEQCYSILNCTHLFYNDIVFDKNKIADCLNKAKRFADFSMTNPQNAILFIHIINKYLYFIDKIDKEEFLDFIKTDNINDLLELTKNHIESMKMENKDAPYLPEIEEYYNNTVSYISAMKKAGNKKILEQIYI